MMDIKRERVKHHTATRRFRRARRLYIFLLRNRINTYRDEVLDYMVDRMYERGLYSKGTHARSVRQSILSHLYHIETGKHYYGEPWYSWLLKNGWDIYHGYSQPIMEKRA